MQHLVVLAVAEVQEVLDLVVQAAEGYSVTWVVVVVVVVDTMLEGIRLSLHLATTRQLTLWTMPTTKEKVTCLKIDRAGERVLSRNATPSVL